MFTGAGPGRVRTSSGKNESPMLDSAASVRAGDACSYRHPSRHAHDVSPSLRSLYAVAFGKLHRNAYAKVARSAHRIGKTLVGRKRIPNNKKNTCTFLCLGPEVEIQYTYTYVKTSERHQVELDTHRSLLSQEFIE